MLAASLCAFGWLYLKSSWTDTSLRQQGLLDQAKVIARYLKVDGNGSIELELPAKLAEAYNSRHVPYRYAVRNLSGQFLFDSKSTVAPLPSINKQGQRLYDYDPDGDGPLHTYGAALQALVGKEPLIIQVERQDLEDNYVRSAAVDEFLEDGGWIEFLFLFVLLAISIGIVRLAIKPLTRLSNLVASIGPANVNTRLPTDQVPVEILPLVYAMNSAFDRLDQGLKRQRDFNANAAHQLRTPLSVLMANISLIQAREPGLASRLKADVDHMTRIVTQLLLVAQLETLSISIDETIDLNAATAEISAGLAPLAIAAGKSIDLARADTPVVIRTNIFALRAALGNLIENAIKHTPTGTSVRLRVTKRPSIEVMDAGAGVPLDQRTKVFERFWRGDRSKSGAGLGLAIVDRIMSALEGTVTVGDSPEGGGLFTLVFPPAAITANALNQEATSLQ